MAVWKFQLYPSQPDHLGHRYSMDSAAKAFEKRVNDALRYPFGFHKVNKLCISLGPSREERPLWREVLGVGDRHYPEFAFSRYLGLSPMERTIELERITKEVFAWLLANFEDSNFVLVATKNLGWTEFPEPAAKPRRHHAQ